MLTFHIITLFPESFESYLASSIVARAIKEKKIRVKFYNPRDFTKAKNKSGYKQVDDKAYGGGPGMVLQALPILRAAEAIKKKVTGAGRTLSTVIFAPEGAQFTNERAEREAKKTTDLILICGRYEGIDGRVKKILKAKEWSVGPYVLTGGELPALVVLDTIARRLPGVLGKDESVEERRLSSGEMYTRPEVLAYRGRNYRVPAVLLSGNHAKIDEWKMKKVKRNQVKTVDK